MGGWGSLRPFPKTTTLRAKSYYYENESVKVYVLYTMPIENKTNKQTNKQTNQKNRSKQPFFLKTQWMQSTQPPLQSFHIVDEHTKSLSDPAR